MFQNFWSFWIRNKLGTRLGFASFCTLISSYKIYRKKLFKNVFFFTILHSFLGNFWSSMSWFVLAQTLLTFFFLSLNCQLGPRLDDRRHRRLRCRLCVIVIRSLKPRLTQLELILDCSGLKSIFRSPFLHRTASILQPQNFVGGQNFCSDRFTGLKG